VPLDLLRTRTTLFCGALALVIAASTLLRGRVRTVHLLFAAFAADVGLWYLSQSLFGFFKAEIWERFTAILAVLLPQLALQLFEAMIPHEPGRRSRLVKLAGVLLLPMALLVIGLPQSRIVQVGLMIYVFALLSSGLFTLGQRGKQSSSRATQRRVRFLVLIGALACLASVAEYASFIVPELPPVGAALSVVFLFMLAQALRHERLLDMYEMLGRLLVATAVAFLLAGIFFVLVEFVGKFNTMYLNAVLVAIVLLVLVDPLRARVEEQIQKLFFRERFDLERLLAEARQRLVHTLQVDEMGTIVVSALEQSRRATAGALYLRDPEGTGFDKLQSFGPGVPARIESAAARALLDRLEKGPVDLEAIEDEVRASGNAKPAAATAVLSAAEALGSLKAGVILGIHDQERALIGLLVLADTRVRDAFSSEEITILQDLAAKIAVVVENSRVYSQMKNRDRLMELGRMAAGLAHEIRNPLGAIKGAAQLLTEPSEGREPDPASHEFLGIILEEVDRLDRVLGSILDYARPNPGVAVPTDVNSVVRQTMRLFANERSTDELHVEVLLDPSLPRVAIDPEQLRQVFMNLYRNAAQAMKGRGRVTVSTRVRLGLGTRPGQGGADEPFVELTVADNGPGISQNVLRNLFQPFFTTKEKGTGLGLATSKNIIEGAGGRIEVRSYEGKGSTFSIVLPATAETIGTPTPAPVSRSSRDLVPHDDGHGAMSEGRQLVAGNPPEHPATTGR
jgi:two-component system sensor histidine kinase HydH